LEFFDEETEVKDRDADSAPVRLEGTFLFNEDVPWLRRYLSLAPASPDPVSPSCEPEPPAEALSISKMRPRLLLPFFCAMLVAVNLGALALARLFFAPLPELPEPVLVAPESPAPFEDLSPAFLWEPEIIDDVVMDTYLDTTSREWVTDFFARICGSWYVADVILKEAVQLSIPPSLAFALSWEESRYDFSAVNPSNRDGSVDRGLFQLNNNSFPKLSEGEFFDPQVNARYGMSHLRMCLDTAGSEVAALAMYNAGSGRVISGGTPRQTLDYVDRVLATRRKIDRVFREEWALSR
jgi:hypothetical protein